MTALNFLDKLAQMRAAHCDRMPTPEMAVLTRATARLRRSGILQTSLQPRETAPDFRFIDSHDQHNSLYELLRQGPVVINFFRGFWCMYCKSEFEAFTTIQEELENLGCQYLAVSPQKLIPESIEAVNCHVIFDRNNQIASMFRLVYTLCDEEIELFKENVVPGLMDKYEGEKRDTLEGTKNYVRRNRRKEIVTERCLRAF